MVNLVLNPSHQINNKCASGDTEADHMRRIGELAFQNLSRHKNLNVYLVPVINTGSDAQNLIKSVSLSNRFIEQNGGSGYHFGLHSDAGQYATGASLLYRSKPGMIFGTTIIEELMALTPWHDIGSKKRTNLYELNNTIAYAAIIEVSFHDSPVESKWIHENAQLIADVISNGIVKSIGQTGGRP